MVNFPFSKQDNNGFRIRVWLYIASMGHCHHTNRKHNYAKGNNPQSSYRCCWWTFTTSISKDGLGTRKDAWHLSSNLVIFFVHSINTSKESFKSLLLTHYHLRTIQSFLGPSSTYSYKKGSKYLKAILIGKPFFKELGSSCRLALSQPASRIICLSATARHIQVCSSGMLGLEIRLRE